MADFKINEFGEIIRDGVAPHREKTPEEEIYEEYHKLVYDLSHPERFSGEEYEQKKKRRTEIEQSYPDFSNNKSVEFKLAQLKLKKKTSQQGNDVLFANIAKFKKQND